MDSKKNLRRILMPALLVLLGGGAGFLSGRLIESSMPADTEPGGFITSLFLQLVLMALAFYLQLILHEGGHLLAGLLTGYRFSSFRIGSLMLLKTSRGLSLKRFSLAGTGGQCLLIPPERAPDGSYPYRLYHLGGVLMNLLTAVLFFVLYRALSAGGYLRGFFLCLSLFGIFNAVMNGLPLRPNGVATDGYNALHIGKEPFALTAMWLGLKINAAQTEGIRLKDLPEEWFVLPEGASKTNEIISTIAVFAENRAMDALDFAGARERLSRLEEGGEYTVMGLYRSLLLLDKITLDLIEKGASADISAMDTRPMRSFRKAMAKFPSVIRAEYALALLKEQDPAGAEKCIKRFESVACRYPMPSDIASERDIMAQIDSAATGMGSVS